MQRTDIIEIDATKLKRMQVLHVAFLLFDVRSRADFDAGHIRGAVQVLSEEFLTKLTPMVPKKDTPIVIYDHNGVASSELAVAAGKMGYLNIVNLEGGYIAYRKIAPTDP